MRFAAKLGVFAAVLIVGSSVYKLGEKSRGNDRDFAVSIAEVPHAPAMPAIAGVPTVPQAPGSPAPALAPQAPHAPSAVEVRTLVVSDAAGDEVRILTHNNAAFLALRDRHLVAGLSDSIRQIVSQEMSKEMAQNRSSGVGEMIEKAVRSSVSKLMEKEIQVPISEIRDIDYKRNRIVIRYKNGEPSGMINLETLKSEGDKGLLEQFSEADARKLVAAVKERLK